MTISKVPAHMLGKKYNGYNWIINGNFRICQRGTSQTGNGYGSDDRWLNDSSGATKTHSRQSFAVGELFPDGTPCPKYYSLTSVVAGSTASDFVTKRQRIINLRPFGNKLVTLSFYAKANGNKVLGIEFKQYFGSGGSPSTAASIQKTVNLTTTWTKFTVTVKLPSMAGKVLGSNSDSYFHVLFWMNAGSNYSNIDVGLRNQSGDFCITNVALVEGDEFVLPISRSHAEETELCLQYFEIREIIMIRYNSNGNHGGTGVHTFRHKRFKLKVPTVTLYRDGNRDTPGIYATQSGITSTLAATTINYGANAESLEFWGGSALPTAGDYMSCTAVIDSEI